MALFQPTNIIPSISTNSGTVSVADTMQVQWQVNGNSAMIAYQIDVLKNDPYSTFIHTTGRITNGCPFYGTDRFGKPQFFTYTASGQVWEEWSKYTMTDGNNYKLKITQWYSADQTVVSGMPNAALSAGTTYYFTISGGGFVSFTPTTSYSTVDTFFYNAANKKAWVVLGSNNRLIQLTMASSTTQPTTGTEIGTMTVNATASKEDFVQQSSASPFITRSQPTVAIQVCKTDDYTNPTDFTSGELNSSIGYFHAKYEQAQNDPVRWIQWQVASASNGVAGDILADTGDIYTSTLDYEFNGFFVGQEYAIRCVIESNNGLQTDTGWVVFTINILDPQNYTGILTAKCLPKENATLLKWDGVTVISGAYTPPENTEQLYSFSDGAVILPANSTITWDNLGKDSSGSAVPMDFSAPWTAVWKGEIEKRDISFVSDIQQLNGSSLSATALAYSPDGKTLILAVAGEEDGHEQAGTFQYSVDGTSVTYKANLTPNVLFAATTIKFSPDGKLLIISGNSSSNTIGGQKTSVFSVDDTTITYVGTITKYYQIGATALAFSPDGKTLVMGNENSASIYAVDGTAITYVSELVVATNGVDALSFSPDGKLLIASWHNSPTVGIYTVDGTTIKQVNTLAFLNSTISVIQFSPDGKTLVMGGTIPAGTLVFSVDGTSITIQGSISRDNKGFCKSNVLAFSPDGKTLVMSYTDSSTNNEYVSIFSADGTSVTLVEDIMQDALLTALAYSPDDNILILGDEEGAHLYSYTIPNEGALLKIGEGATNLQLSIEGFAVRFLLDGASLAGLTLPYATESLTVIIGQDYVTASYYNQTSLISTEQKQVTYSQEAVTSIQIFGGEEGATVANVALFNNQQSSVDIPTLYIDNPNFEPEWNAEEYSLYMTANFNGNIEGGTGSGSGAGFRIYRQEYGSNILTPIATLSANITSLKDYGISSRKVYRYSLYAYDTLNAFMSSVEADNLITTNFKNYSLLVCSYDAMKDEYHVRKQYLFALNVTDNGASNNNTPTINANFTPYPTVMKSVQNYKSGTLSALIGTIYTKQALVEQIGNYKCTTTPSTLDYFDSINLEKELYDLSVTPYTLFLRDMKGHLRMVQASGAITQTPYIKSAKQQITISFPWVEVGDASDVTIIQTPEDYGWDYDNQVLDVELNVETTTGELWGTYPYPYNGTRFYLAAGTPIGTTPARFNMSETAEKTTDGQVTATVKINNEVN